MIFLIDKQKLAIHVKRQTIQLKDMQYLHDIWKTIDFKNSLRKESQYLTRNTHYHHEMKITKKFHENKMKTCAKIKCLTRQEYLIPRKLAHFTAELNLETVKSMRLIADR